MVNRITHREHRADYIRKKPHYRILKHLLYCIQYKSITYLKMRVWHYKYRGMTFQSKLAEVEMAGMTKEIEASEMTIQKLVAVSDYLFTRSTYADKIVMQLAQDEIPNEAFLFYL